MAQFRFLAAIGFIASAQPGLAAAQQSGAIGASSQPSRSDDRVRGAFFASTLSGAGEMEAAARKQRETQRKVTIQGSGPEAALLAGAGLLSATGHLRSPFCAEENGQPSFDCQIVRKRQKSR